MQAIMTSRLMRDWLPPIAAGAIAGLAFLLFGNTPIVRAAGLALVVVGMAATLRWLGAILAFAGSLALAFSPAFWAQTGGGNAGPATIVLALVGATIVVLAAIIISRKPALGFIAGVVIFAIVFWTQVGTPRSLRLTSFVTTWLFYLLLDTLRRTNPHPEDDTTDKPSALYYPVLMLILFAVGVINDPVFTLIAPALILGLWLAHFRLPMWYWALLLIATGVGIYGIFANFVIPDTPLIQLQLIRDANRWMDLLTFIIGQFGLGGILLGTLGLARFARWYPVAGIVSMVAYGAYALFGISYNGADKETLLLPLFIIQIFWMTYAVFTLGEWARKSSLVLGNYVRLGIHIAALAIPVMMLLRLLGTL